MCYLGALKHIAFPEPGLIKLDPLEKYNQKVIRSLRINKKQQYFCPTLCCGANTNQEILIHLFNLGLYPRGGTSYLVQWRTTRISSKSDDKTRQCCQKHCFRTLQIKQEHIKSWEACIEEKSWSPGENSKVFLLGPPQLCTHSLPAQWVTSSCDEWIAETRHWAARGASLTWNGTGCWIGNNLCAGGGGATPGSKHCSKFCKPPNR